ncbi:trans-aconitate methyltransferase 1 [Coemansia biformis]|uniref:Trans-aconitate methyltransferase 1 n=1 Tax=Coemansia biformis TaxID=1286918 RepID=A0A9W7YIM8_9FUNG|nr:trans-aconitate methyltransferase 1 [Coemansia biformis]
MATYSEQTYDAGSYQASRPRYKDSLVDTVLDYHRKDNPAAGTDLAVDVATGTGIFARQLPSHFARVVATDLSATMLDSARKAPGNASIEYVEAPAEDLSFLGAGSVDVMTVACAAHWFDVERFVAEAGRVLKPSGTLAIFGYTGFGHFVDYPQCDRMLKDFGLSDDKLGAYWDKGRELLVNGYRAYHEVLVRKSWMGIQRHINADVIEKEPSSECPATVVPGSAILHFEVTWRTLRDFLLTWSCVHKFHSAHAEQENAAKVVIREMMAAAGATDVDEPLSIHWEEVMLVCHPPQAAD